MLGSICSVRINLRDHWIDHSSFCIIARSGSAVMIASNAYEIARPPYIVGIRRQPAVSGDKDLQARGAIGRRSAADDCQ